jgi:hypothetical protein
VCAIHISVFYPTYEAIPTQRLLLFLSILVFPLLGQTATPPAAGDGSAGNPWQIATLENLYWISQTSSSWGDNFVLTADIDATQTAGWNGGAGFTPIASQATPFTGTLDGNDHIISNLYFAAQSADPSGLFDKLDGATVSNLRIFNATFDGASESLGALAGSSTSSALTNIQITVTITSSVSANIGGMVGASSSDVVHQSSISGTLNFDTGAAGFFAGRAFGTVFTETFVTGSLTGNSGRLGGFSGISSSASYTDCYSRVQIGGAALSGGFDGLGVRPTYTRCYSASSIGGNNSDGGIAGDIFAGFTATDVFWDYDYSGLTSTYGPGEAKTTTEMQTQSTYTNWDFANTWVISANEYPRLQWQDDQPVSEPDVTLFSETDNYGLSVIFNGSVNPQGAATDYYFEYSTSSGNYGEFSTPVLSAGEGFSPVNVTAQIEGLNLSTVYYYRIVASSSEGTVYSSEKSFETRPIEVYPPTAGDGSGPNPWQIADFSHLVWLSITPSVWNSSFIMIDDIDASVTTDWYGDQSFNPIGNSTTRFNGEFDGQGYTIFGLTINEYRSHSGLFGYIYGAELRNLRVTGLTLSSGYYASVLVGQAWSAVISDCYVSGFVDGTLAGLISGYAQSTTITNVTARGEVEGFSESGLGVGYLLNSTVNGVGAIGSLYCQASNSGGLIGYIDDTNVANSYAQVDVFSDGQNVGGFIGTVRADVALTISNCYSTGSVTGDSQVAGFIGDKEDALASVSGCYWNTETSGQGQGVAVGSSAGIAGRNTAQMRHQATFSGWDFPTTWKIIAGSSFPYLAFEETPGIAPSLEFYDAENVMSSSAVFNFSVNPNASQTTAFLRYGTNPDALNQTTSPVLDAGSSPIPVPLSQTLSGLQANTRYYAQLVATNANGTSESTLKSFVTAPQTSVPAGSGSPADPYEIATLTELAWLMVSQDHWDQSFELVADIDASETASWFDGKGFQPIGEFPFRPFTGRLDGNGFSISGLSIDRSNEEDVAIFAATNGANISNLVLTGMMVTGGIRAAGLIGSAEGTTLSNISVTAEIVTPNNAGGAVAYIDGSPSSLTDIRTNVVIRNSYYAGGLVGSVRSATSITRCESRGQAFNCTFVGGLGNSYTGTGTVTQSFSNFDIYESEGAAGGLFYSFGDGIITNSYASGSIDARIGASGFIDSGANNGRLTNCYSTVSVVAEDPEDASGFARRWTGGSVSNCFWDNEKSGQTTSAAGLPKTTSEMQTQSTFTGWDFGSVWQFAAGNYPFLQWQQPATPMPPVARTEPVSSITTSTAQLNGLVTPLGYATTYFFEIGITSGVYTLQSPLTPAAAGAGIEAVEVSTLLSGLETDRTYFFRLVATNAGGTTNSTESSFRTAPDVAAAPGSGTEEDPYRISTLSHLLWVSDTPSSWSAHFDLVSNIDLSQTGALNNGLGFDPIGDQTTPFSGTFNGNNHILSNLGISRIAENNIGLFGVTRNAIIEGLGLHGVSITGASSIGGLVGKADNSTVIRECFVSGLVSGPANTGGIAGWLDTTATLVNSYNLATISGENNAGGLVGYNFSGSIDFSFSAAPVSGEVSIGGAVGRSFEGATSNTYWDTQVSGQNLSAGGAGRTTAQMQQLSTFTGWNFTSVWHLISGATYPYLSWEKRQTNLSLTVAGTGSQSLPVGSQSGIGQIDFTNVTTPGDIVIQYFVDIPLAPSGIPGTVSQYRWIIEPGDLVIDEAAGYSIRFNLADLFDFGGINEYTGADPNVSDIRLYKRDTPGSGAFAQVPGFLEYYNNGTIGDQSDDYMISPLITDGFSEFAFGTEGDHSLPVELTTFRASAKDRQVELFWKTASELLNSGFNVYRSDSEEGEYQEISSYRYNEDLEGLGTSAHGQDYRFTDNDFRLLNDATYYYKIADVDVNGVVTMHGPVTATPTASEGDEQVARMFKLYPNYPNPFNPTTTIVVDLEEFTDEALIEVYDITGRLVKTLYNGPINQYRIMVNWDGTNNAGNTLSTGMYFYRYRSANRDIMRKMILMK